MATIFQTWQAEAYAFGQFGYRDLSTGQSSIEGEIFHTIHALEESVFDAESAIEYGDSSSEGTPLTISDKVYGAYTNVDCTSGLIRCYLKEPA